jgi:hypothetical protein
MDELLATTPVESTEVATEPSNETTTQNDSNLEQQDDSNVDAEVEFDEVDFKGNKYKIPKELAPIIAQAENLEAGYTRRFQEASELRKAVEAERQTFQREQQINSEMSQEISQLLSVESRLNQFVGINWQQLYAENPQNAGALNAEYTQLRDAYGELHGTVQNRKAEIAAIHEQQTATMYSQSIEALSKPDPERGWAGKFDVTTRDTLTKFGKEIGYSDEELAGTNHPLMIKTLNLARIGYESLKKQKAAASPQKTVANPVPQVGASKSRSSVDPDKLPIDQWVKYERERLRKVQGR